MDRYDVQLGPSTAFMKGMHIPAVGLRVTPLCIVGYVSEFPLFKIRWAKRNGKDYIVPGSVQVNAELIKSSLKACNKPELTLTF